METIHLQSLVSKLMADITPATTRRRSFLINEIAPGIHVTGNTDHITEVLNRLLSNMAHHVSDTCIRISAKKYRDVVFIQLRDPNSPGTYTIAQGLYNAQQIAEEIGGYLGFSSQGKHETTIVFSFPNLALSA